MFPAVLIIARVYVRRPLADLDDMDVGIPINSATCTPPAIPSSNVKIRNPQKTSMYRFFVTPKSINALDEA